MKKIATFAVIILLIGLSIALTPEVNNINSKENKCLNCHGDIEPIVPPQSGMMKAILQKAEEAGVEGNDCVVCHGGNPATEDLNDAHSGTIDFFKHHPGPKNFYPDPGSPWINENTCGVCHKEQVQTQFTSLMFTEAGKIQGTTWGFGGINRYNHNVGNYDVSALEKHQQLGSEVYKKYLEIIKKAEEQVFPSKMTALPPAPTPEQVEKDPRLAVYTYLRQECQRCHTGNKGRQKRGDYRGMGCSSCHIPYSNEGYYEGKDKSVPTGERGHLLVHSIQATRDKKVHIHGKTYSGIPVETCTTCHDRGKRIGTSYQGLMETAYSSPFMGDGREQPKLHTKHYLHLHADVHLEKGMLCQDCHTSSDVHGDGLLYGTTLAPVEIECQDCHGTPDKYPWELPVGYSDEIADFPDKSPRGLADELPEYIKKGMEYPKEDGYLISARGNPLQNVVKKGNEVIVHTAGGKDIILQPLKKLNKEDKLSVKAKVAMVNVQKHIEKMECYACHADWAPQCYGCHIKIDYSKEEYHTDWVSVGHDVDESGLTADARGATDKHQIPGKITEQRSYLRWENPPLVVNGESRIAPAIPGCQTTVSVIGKDGKPLLLNHIFKIPQVEGADSSGQLAIDISPVQPHTTSKKARDCESCHNNPASMGYGIEEGQIFENPSEEYVVELASADGEILPEKYRTQINKIPNLTMDWSRFVTEEGRQLQTIGHHFSKSRPLNNQERANLDRRGVCLSCHQDIPDGNLAVDLLMHVRQVADKNIDNREHQSLLNKILNFAAWGQVGAGFFLLILIIRIIRKNKPKKE